MKPNQPIIRKTKTTKMWVPTIAMIERTVDETNWTARPKYESDRYGHGSSIAQSIDGDW